MIAEFTPAEAQWLDEHWHELSDKDKAVISRRVMIGEITPLPGAELPWQEWLARYCADATRYPLAPHHVEAWEWFDALQPGIRPPALIAAFSRGHGKSTTGELGVVRTCVKGTRHFALYVKASLESANKHIHTIARRFEKIGVNRQVNKYGLAVNWNAQQLTTQNGFSVISFGVDGAVRGIKLETFRPDLILIDDIDELGDSAAEILKKIEALSNSILPTGSDDMAVAFLQNPQQPNSVMSQMLDGRADMLKNRITLGPIPALRDFTCEERIDPDNVKRHYILTGTPTWEGKPREKCQEEIHTYGYSAFLRECQHDISRTGIYFTNFNTVKHVRKVNQTYGPCPVCEAKNPNCVSCGGTGKYVPAPMPPPRWWNYFGGLDYGRRSPFSFHLYGVTDSEEVKVLSEVYETDLEPSSEDHTNPGQAELILAVLKSFGLDPRSVPIYCDPSIFPARDEQATISHGRTIKPGWSMTTNAGKYISEMYQEAGLQVYPAMSSNSKKERYNGWGAVNAILDKPDCLTIYEEACPNLIRELKQAPCDSKDPDDVDSSCSDHAIDDFRHFCRARWQPAEIPPEKPAYVPMWMRNKRKGGYA